MTDLEDRIRKLEERVSIQDDIIKRTLDFVQHGIDQNFERKRTHYEQRKEEMERDKKIGQERIEAVKAKMKELGYTI